ncbi:unnamed protein product [Macrosiphum euphorbiae]|uniref:Uncharacterized protein n=1 Tax=Macrosiphum euphorbiae TaxID=13131 RepID=A0AAV0Y662_9HEMI|nr:unnamed protein product [Macrosiphum euphorbiae]
MKPNSDEQQETVMDAENNGDHNGSNQAGRDNSSWLDQLRTCSLEFIRSNPGLSHMYDRGFAAGFYGRNQMQLEALMSGESAASVMSEAGVTSADAELGSPLEAVGADSWATAVAMDNAIESALKIALEVSANSSMVVSRLARDISQVEP